MNPLTPSQVDTIRAHLARRMTATQSARELGVRKDTVLKYRRQISPLYTPRCECGRPITHAGQCTARTMKFNIPHIIGARIIHGYAHG
jgi:hypothetical protein